MNYNKVILGGYLTCDPELRFTPNGKSVTTFGVAVNETYKDRSGEYRTEPNFFNHVVVWGKLAENCAEFIKKGSSVFIEGRLRSEKWETKNGEKRTTTKIIVNKIQFMSKKN